MKDKNLNLLRSKIDSIDDQLLNLIVKRTSIVDKIGTLKKDSIDVVDKDRETEVGLIRLDPRKVFSRKDILRKWQEQGGKCFYTGIPIDEDNLAGDHYIPRSFGIDAGGVTEYDNLVVCTKGLNLRKLNMHGDDFVKLLKKESEQAA